MGSLYFVHDVEVSFNTTLHHLLQLEDLMFHLLQPLLGAPLHDWSLQIFLVENTVLRTKDLGVLVHLSEVRVDDVDNELVLGGNLGKPWHLGLAKRFLGRNRLKRKHTKSRDMLPERSGQIYSKNFCNKRKVTSQSGVGDGVLGAQAASRRGQEVGRARGAPRPPGARLRLHLGLEFS